jgi:PhnB protein
MSVNPIPKGYHTATPYLVVKGGVQAMEFYKKAFGAIEMVRMPLPDGRLGHAEIKIGDSMIMFADEFPERGHVSPTTLGGSPVGVMLYVTDVDAVIAQAKSAGATEIEPVTDKFYGDRSGALKDPFGHLWTIATHVEDVTPEEMQKRMAQAPRG